MPCDTSHLEPTAQETEARRVAAFLQWLDQQFRIGTPDWIIEAASHPCGQWATSDELGAAERASILTRRLCDRLRDLTDEQMERIVYNAHNVTARELASWWEEHQAADQAKSAGAVTDERGFSLPKARETCEQLDQSALEQTVMHPAGNRERDAAFTALHYKQAFEAASHKAETLRIALKACTQQVHNQLKRLEDPDDS